MNDINKHIKKLISIRREKHHPLVHHIHKKYNISRKTLFYIKEYGPHSHVVKTIMKESLKILFLASIISSLGGFALEFIKPLFVSFIPLVIMLPALNNMIGAYGAIISSRFTTLLHEGKVGKKLFKNAELKNIFCQVMIISIITTIFSLLISFLMSYLGKGLDFNIALKIVIISLIDVMFLICLIFIISIVAGVYYYKNNEDPNNFLIPITTSIADFGNMGILAVLIIIFL